MDIMLPNGSTVDVPYDIAQYIHCLKNFHEAVECAAELHKIDKWDIFITIMNIEKYLKDYDRSLTDGLCRNCKKE